MNIKYGIMPETFKLITGNLWTYNSATIESYSKNISLTTAKNDWAAFQIILSVDEDCALNVGNTPWFSQKGQLLNVRLGVCSEFEAKLNLIGMHSDDDNLQKADVILTQSTIENKKNVIQSIWVEVKIPDTTKSGTYEGKVSIYTNNMFDNEEKYGEITFTIEVIDYEMPSTNDYKFHLDLWQHSSNIARKHEVSLWSDEHFAVLENYVRSLGELGQKAVTVVVSEVPWSGQSCFNEYRQEANLFEYSIIPITKNIDNSFEYDFTKMQHYIDLCARYNINREIGVYGLANIWCDENSGFIKIAEDYPDGMKIRYFDRATCSYKYMNKAVEIDSYIVAIEQYFIDTKQMEIVRLAADEPSDIEAYRKSIGHIKEIAPAFKFKAAINHSVFIPEFGNEVYDFVPSLGSLCSEYDKIVEYKNSMEDKRFLWYVCCGPEYPNTFIKSNLVESLFIGVLTSYANLDGFLRWSYTIWNDNPRSDVRYGPWRAGDTNLVYPANNGSPLLSLRYKSLKRGIELYELLEAIRAKGERDVLEAAYNYVVVEKDIRNYFGSTQALNQMCSLNYDDYNNMKKYLLINLSK